MANNVCRLLGNTHRIIVTHLGQSTIIYVHVFIHWARSVQVINMYHKSLGPDTVPWSTPPLGEPHDEHVSPSFNFLPVYDLTENGAIRLTKICDI